jgi:hypothetical protein
MIQTREQLRSTILDGIGQILARPLIDLMLSADQIAVLKAERSYWSTDDAACDKLLAILPTVEKLSRIFQNPAQRKESLT